MFSKRDYMNQIECSHLAGKLGLTEMQSIVEGKEATTKAGEFVVHCIQKDLITMEQFKGLVIQIEECSTANLMGCF